jgi:hypothetical protein
MIVNEYIPGKGIAAHTVSDSYQNAIYNNHSVLTGFIHIWINNRITQSRIDGMHVIFTHR